MSQSSKPKKKFTEFTYGEALRDWMMSRADALDAAIKLQNAIQFQKDGKPLTVNDLQAERQAFQAMIAIAAKYVNRSESLINDWNSDKTRKPIVS